MTKKQRKVLSTALALAAIVCLLSPACKKAPETMGTTPGAAPDEYKSNRPPQLKPLFAEHNGRRIPIVYPGMTVTVNAHATDPDGDIIRYRWIVSQGSGTIDSQAEPAVSWKAGTGDGLLLIAYDGRGGQARERLTISKKDVVVFSGRIVSNLGPPIDGAEIQVEDAVINTDKQGYFKLPAKRTSPQRYVLNIRKSGFGLVSRIYDRGIQDGRWTMTKGTVVLADPTQPIVVQDTSPRTGCLGPLSGRIDWSLYPEQRIPRIFDTAGQPLNQNLPQELRDAIAVLEALTECSPGITVSIPANALVDASGNPLAGKVEVTVSTVDLYDPDSMPGDMSVDMEGEGGFMQSFGAGTVSIMSGGKPVQLKKGSKAELTIPVDPTQLKVRAPIEATIPFLRYDEKKGSWILLGTADLNAKGDAYTAEIEHLSAFNTDLVKTNQSCVKIDSSQLQETFRLEVIIPMGGGTAPVVKTFTIAPDALHPEDPDLHAIYNLPSNTWIMMIAIRENPANTFIPLGTFVVPTGAPQNPSTPNRPVWNYSACQSQISLYEVLPKVSHVVDGTNRKFGPLPVHIYALADQSNVNEIYPIGTGAYYQFCLFDTGSTKVRIFNEIPYYFSAWPTWDPDQGLICNVPDRVSDANYWKSDAEHLGLTGAVTARVRLNGLNAIYPDRTAPIGPPGSANAPQIELSGIQVVPQPSPPPSQPALDVSLMGVPITHQVVAAIDYTSYKEVVGYNFYPGLTDPGNSNIAGFQKFTKVYGPDITFYAPNDPAIPYSQFGLFLELERWGTPKRYSLKNVTFKEGTAEVSNQDLAGNKFLHYDTATTITIINDDFAGQLGLVAGAGTFDCFTTGDKLGYVIDEVTMTGPNGTYKIQNAMVCWDESRIVSSGVVAAVIGSNFFDKVPVLFDGPRNRLGIGIPTTTPVNWVVIPRNCN